MITHLIGGKQVTISSTPALTWLSITRWALASTCDSGTLRISAPAR